MKKIAFSPILAQHTANQIPFTNDFLIFGGVSEQNKKLVYSDVLYQTCHLSSDEIMFLKVDTFGNGPSARSRHTSIFHHNSFFVFGGSNESCYFQEIFCLDFATKIWAQIHFETTSPYDPFGFDQICYAFNDTIYIFGGKRKKEPFYPSLYSFSTKRIVQETAPFHLADRPGNVCLFGEVRSLGAKDMFPSPVLIEKLEKVVQIAGYANSLYARTIQNQLYLIGENRLAFHYSIPKNSLQPFSIFGNQKQIRKVACGALHGCALDEEGQVYIWGDESKGFCFLYTKKITCPNIPFCRKDFIAKKAEYS